MQFYQFGVKKVPCTFIKNRQQKTVVTVGELPRLFHREGLSHGCLVGVPKLFASLQKQKKKKKAVVGSLLM